MTPPSRTSEVPPRLVTHRSASDSATGSVAAAIWSAKGKDGASLGGIAIQEFTRQADGSLKLRLHTFN